MTLSEFREGLRKFRDAERVLKRVVLNATRRARNESRRQLVRTPLGRALKKKKSIPITLTRATAKRDLQEGGIVGSFSAKGMTGLIDVGGKTEPTEITPKGNELVFPGTGAFAGSTIRTRSVQHPGSIVRRQNIIEPVVDREAPVYEAELADTVETHAAMSFK